MPFVCLATSLGAQLAGPSTLAVPRTEVRVIQPGLAGGAHVVTPTHLYLSILESQEGRDLNGDGDLEDGVLHRISLPAGARTNLGLAGEPRLHRPGELLFVVDERAQRRRDLNGDGDRGDFVWHVFHEESGTIENLRLVGMAQGDRELASLLVDELQQGADLDGNGDQQGRVLHVWPRGGTPFNLALRVESAEDIHVLAGERIAFVLPEATSGDRNGDGDALDRVVHVFHGRNGLIENLGLAVVRASRAFLATRETLGFLVPEAAQGGVDLNGDGDALDDVLHLLETGAGLRNLALASVRTCSLDCTPFFQVEDEWVVVSVGEAVQGAIDLDGDGDATGVVQWAVRIGGSERRIVSTRRTSPDMETGDFWAGPEGLSYNRFESRDGVDWNGDGDQTDLVLFVRRYDEDAEWNTGLATESEPMNLSQRTEAAGRWQVVLVSEQAQGGLDRNGDGDSLDRVAAVLDLRARTVRNTRLASSYGYVSGSFTQATFVLDEERLFVNCLETAQGRDLDQDGDLLDGVVQFHELRTGTTLNTGVPAAYWPPRNFRGGMPIAVAEAPGRDLNGDGDHLDVVTEVLRIRSPRP